MIGTRRLRPSARAALLWGLTAALAAQLVFVALADTFAPEVYDPVYAARLSRLRAKRIECPNSPLLLVLGSSRTCGLFRPEELPPLTAPDGRTVVPFNFSRPGGGPVYCRFAYSRLCREGLAPDWLIVELMPPLFERDTERYFCPGMTAAELPELGGYISHRRALGAYAKRHVLPWRYARVGLFRKFAPSWVVPGADSYEAVDVLGGQSLQPPTDSPPDPHRKPLPPISQMPTYHIDPDLGRAYRTLLAECCQQGTRVIVLLTPESEDLRALYPADGLVELDRYCAGLTAEFGIPVIDTRSWLAEGQFLDAQHPNSWGQRVYTERLGREVLVPFVAGQSVRRPEPTPVGR